MTYLLDTHICVYLIKRKPPQVLARFRSLIPGEVGLSSITLAELRYGVAKSQYSEKNRQALENFLLPLEIYRFDSAAAMNYGNVRAELERAGTLIGPLDMLIAAHALSLGSVLVTNNLREFQRVEKLKTENWADASNTL